ncbi:dihydroxyacetone kinase subunit DhaL [Methylomarinum sp. Ch1-1]|uniref:Dihydroxyacetone kinase subunit DhaL n=1 Tax=Methylomarinum roseum TaxID=3067653 RepID=A0AAU7NYS1_9GAMM|nr:dihydroxyacetone kinase subunit DhaL [Methylomarinum sp. Ch1-1]MDP4521771.1 dihydroxyacetone kinase subunit DhaL [Methylomarinum sp. Ch1-1]
MQISPLLLPEMIEAIDQTITANAEEVTALDQEIGDGDHVYNLQRGIDALKKQEEALSQLDWVDAWQKIGMTLMSKIGGASGSLYGTFFVTMSKAARDQQMDLSVFADALSEGVESIKKRGRADVGEKTMLDVLAPVAECLKQAAADNAALPELLNKINQVAEQGVESTRDMVATKGRASFLGERTKGHIDAGAKTAQLMIAAVVSVIEKQ